jgi:hypothetical protein
LALAPGARLGARVGIRDQEGAVAVNTYAVGQQIRVTATFKVGSTPTNPTTVTASVKDPAGTVTAVGTANPSTGVYTIDVALSSKGRWVYRFAGTGACVAAAEGEVNAVSEVV